jgi:hypothetical protein
MKVVNQNVSASQVVIGRSKSGIAAVNVFSAFSKTVGPSLHCISAGIFLSAYSRQEYEVYQASPRKIALFLVRGCKYINQTNAKVKLSLCLIVDFAVEVYERTELLV